MKKVYEVSVERNLHSAGIRQYDTYLFDNEKSAKEFATSNPLASPVIREKTVYSTPVF